LISQTLHVRSLPHVVVPGNKLMAQVGNAIGEGDALLRMQETELRRKEFFVYNFLVLR